MDLAKLTAELERDEGRGPMRNGRLLPYRDSVGKLSIGIGRNLDDKGISLEEAHALLRNDIVEHLDLLDKYLPWWRKLDDERQRALANMAFNLGVGPSEEQPQGKLLTFRNTLAAIERGDYQAAAEGMAASRWARQVGARADRLVAMMRG